MIATGLRRGLLVAFVALLVFVFIGARSLRRLRSDLAAAQHLAQAAQQGNVEREAVIVALRAQAKREAQARTALQREHTRLRAFYAHRETTIRNLQHDHPAMHRWAKRALPDVLIRLRRHAPFTRATDYSQRRPEREPVPVTGDRAADER